MRVVSGLAAFFAVALSATVVVAQERVVRDVYEGRPYRLYLPAAPARHRPLIVALHGCAQTPEDFALGTRLDKAAGRRGLRVLYPAQPALDNPARCWNWFLPARGEEAEVLALVRQTLRVHASDATGAVVLGLSAGGYMAVNLVCAAPDLVIGVGVVAGGPYRCANDTRTAIACMRGENPDGTTAAARCRSVTGKAFTARAALWHGDGDSVVSPANLIALTEMFVTLRAPRPTGFTERRDGAVRSVYRAPDGQPVIESWLVQGMGHAWSGGDTRGTHTYPAGPDATEAMLRFLLER